MERVPQLGLAYDSYNPLDAPIDVLSWPGMTSPREKGMLYWLARNMYDGEGIIVDAGIFLGASTNAFATGLKAGESAPTHFKPINCYDTAIWVRSMNRYLTQTSKSARSVQNAIQGGSMQPGKSFAPALRKLLAPHLDVIDFHFGDIVREANSDRMIEIAFYDCLKTQERDWAAFRAFGPWYESGKTLVVQQDYFYESAADLKIRQEFLAPYFTFLGAESTSAVFRLDRAIPEQYFQEDPILSLSFAEKVALLRQAATRPVDPKFRIYTRLSIVEYLAAAGEIEDASSELAEIADAAASLDPSNANQRPLKLISAFESRLNTLHS